MAQGTPHHLDPPAPGTDADTALQRLAQTEGQRLYAFLRRLCHNDADAADAAQETLLNAYRGWPRFKGESTPRTWLYRIATNVCRKRRSKARRRELSLDGDAITPSFVGPIADPRAPGGALEEVVRREAVHEVREAITALPEGYRLPIVLKELAGLSIEECAGVLDLTPQAVKTRLHRARLALRAAIEQHLPTRDLPPAAYEMSVCRDLLHAKQDALDRGVPFPQAGEVACERCRAVFASLDLVSEGVRADDEPTPRAQDLLSRALARERQEQPEHERINFPAKPPECET